MKKSEWQGKNESAVSAGAIVAILAILMVGLAPASSRADTYNADGMTLRTTTDGRIDVLTMGGSTIDFADDGFGNPITGGFYVRDFSFDPNTGLPAGVTNLIPVDGSTFAEGSITGATPEWTIFTYDNQGAPGSSVTEEVLSFGSETNRVAMLQVDEDENNVGGKGWYAAIYRDIEVEAVYPAPATHELYCLTFEVKTECGWRSLENPNGFDDGGAAKYGRHRVSAWVEWSDGQLAEPVEYPQYPELFRNPQGGNPPQGEPMSFWDRFDAYGVSQNMDANGLTKFSGRTYRPLAATHARVVLIADGFMPNDGNASEQNFVYIDNVCFFKAPDMKQVEGGNLLDRDNFASVELFELGTAQSCDLEMDVDIDDSSGDYLRVSGSLINLKNDNRAIDLGFALPVLNETGSQELTWNYDVRNSIILNDADDYEKLVPFSYSGPIDNRPLISSKGRIPTTKFTQFHGLQVSAYPISSLDIDQGGATVYGLSFGNSLNESETDNRTVTPNVSHFGYWIVDPATMANPQYFGQYFVEFNIGLLGGGGEETDFDFIIFRSDNPEYAEGSSFREGLQKFQRSFYPNNFTRPTATPEADWLFGGGEYSPDPDDGGSYHGFDAAPNDYGIRYVQELSPDQSYLEFCADKNLAILLYARPWSASYHNSDTSASHNTYDTNYYHAHYDAGSVFAYYGAQLAKRILLPPLGTPPDPPGGDDIYQDLFPRLSEAIPTIVADSWDVGNAGSVVSAFDTLLESAYDAHDQGGDPIHGECFGGVMLDNTFGNMGRSNYLDLGYGANDLATFSGQGGRLTYCYNHFQPAIPQLCGNAWFLPHLQRMLEARDDDTGGDNSLAGNIEQEVLVVNANESKFGGSKYGVILSDVNGFESNVGTYFNNSDHAFNFRRSLARDKTVSRQFEMLPCLAEALSTIFDETGEAIGQSFWAHNHDLLTQIVDEASWLSLAWGFHPAVCELFIDDAVIDLLGGDDSYDQIVEEFFHDRFIAGGSFPNEEADVGLTEVSRQLHFAGWKPVTNVVNTASTTSQAMGDPSALIIERFGPFEGGPPNRPVYVTVLNNETLTLTMTDLVDCISSGVSISDLADDLEVEWSNICQDKYANADEYRWEKNECFTGQEEIKKKRNFWLEISDIDLLGLDNFNLKGMQLIGHVANPDAVNSSTIRPATFAQHGPFYSVQRKIVLGSDPFVRIGGASLYGSPYQSYKVMPDKALMVFKIWVDKKVDNDKDGGDGRDSEESPNYRAYGNWTRTTDQRAWEGSADVAFSTDPNASALFLMDICKSGRYDICVSFPELPNGTSGAKYEVYQVEGDWSETGEIEAMESTLLMATIVDQSCRETSAVDEEGFVSIGEVDVNVGREAGQVTVVVRVSSGGAEYRAGEPTLLLADAVKFEEVVE